MDHKLRERIEAKLAEPTDSGCKLWIGAKNSNGLGVISKGGKLQQARRVVYEEYVGPITKAFIRMTCGNALCMTPEHMVEDVVPNDGGRAAGHWQPFEPREDEPPLTTSTGETKTIHQWLKDPRVKVNASVLRSRLRDMRDRQRHNEDWKDHPRFAEGYSGGNPWGYKKPTWTVDTALFTPRNKKLTQWEI